MHVQLLIFNWKRVSQCNSCKSQFSSLEACGRISLALAHTSSDGPPTRSQPPHTHTHTHRTLWYKDAWAPSRLNDLGCKLHNLLTYTLDLPERKRFHFFESNKLGVATRCHMKVPAISALGHPAAISQCQFCHSSTSPAAAAAAVVSAKRYLWIVAEAARDYSVDDEINAASSLVGRWQLIHRRRTALNGTARHSQIAISTD